MSGAARIVIESRPGETRACAVDEHDRPLAFRIERETDPSLVGAICLGRVRAVRKEIGAAFVDIGVGDDGFLNIRDAATDALGTDVREGAAILVQVNRDAEGDKGPALSAGIDIAGASLVLTPGRPGLGLSGRISDETERTRLKTLFQDIDTSAHGLVVRTAAAALSDDAVRGELAALQDRWQDLQNRLQGMAAPACVQPAPGLAVRMISQFAGPDTREILVDDADLVAGLMVDPRPVLAPAHTPAFTAAGLDDAYDAALSPHVALASGGSLIITETPAMTTVDVNAGRTAAGNPERLALETNIEAAATLARELMVRGIGGLIAVDFLKMRDAGSQKRFLAALNTAFRDDPEKPRTGTFSRFGLVDIVRRSRGASLGERVLRYAQTLSPESLALDALARIARGRGSGVTLRCSAEVCDCLNGPLAEIRKNLERRLGFVIRVEPVPGAGADTLEIETR
ncbi:MAG: ribonuclease E/G [Rhodospirillales bacterium]